MFTSEQKSLIDKLSKVNNLINKIQSLLENTEKQLGEIRSVELAIKKIVDEKTQGFPWLADAISQYFELRDLKIAEFLEKKLRPGLSSAERVKELAKEKREFQKKFIVTRNLIKYYESLFPWLPDFVGEDIDELLVQVTHQDRPDEEEIDPVRHYLAQGEYEKLSTTERNQRALDRYWTQKKNPWQIGRDYERYIGYLYEQKGFSVYYQGIEKGLEDLGRDLICKKANKVEIVQCKYWREDKVIHEKHINQLFGTTVEFYIKNIKPTMQGKLQLEIFPTFINKKDVTATLITSATVSDTAKEFASVLNINVIEHFPFEKYPSIKCNVSHRDGTKIYHLPFDQQYDRTTIDEERNECYVATVKEAEQMEFRRAWKWRGNNLYG
jgi:hypothetical protein